MELYVAGGCGEHGRNCFLVEGKQVRFLVDCGIKADCPENPYPDLSKEQIADLKYVFLTHSHADHTGALQWLLNRGFQGTVIASRETFRQIRERLPFTQQRESNISVDNIQVEWGRSGHCAGSVWYHFFMENKSIFFSGDYTEHSLIYTCDAIRKQTADVAVLDCAYGLAKLSFQEQCHKLIKRTRELLRSNGIVVFPVPKYGRGLDLFMLFQEEFGDVPFYADEIFMDNLWKIEKDEFWYQPVFMKTKVIKYNGEDRGIVFISDPQLRTKKARQIVDKITALGAKAIMTGTVEEGSCSEQLIHNGSMEMISYPVHLNFSQYLKLMKQNHFHKTIPYHSAAFANPKHVLF